jgi:hypothetical protein
MCERCVEIEMRLMLVDMEARGYLEVTPSGIMITKLGMDVWRQAGGR